VSGRKDRCVLCGGLLRDITMSPLDRTAHISTMFYTVISLNIINKHYQQPQLNNINYYPKSNITECQGNQSALRLPSKIVLLFFQRR